MTYYLKNTSGSTVNVIDLGISLPDSQSLVIDSNAINAYLTTDLTTAITSGDLILSTTDIGDNGGDMSAADAIAALSITSRLDRDNPHSVTITQSILADSTTDITTAELEQLSDGSETALHIHDDRYYTETELSTSNAGVVSVHWDNIINAPQFGSLEWQEPALGNLTGMGATGSEPTSPTTGDFYLNTDDNHLYQYDGTSWVDQGAPVVGDRVVFKDGTNSDDKIYEWDGSTWVSDPAPEDNWAIIVSDDGDGKSAQYVYDSSGTPPDWIKIADVDWGSHTALADRDAADSHPGTAISFDPTGTDLSSTDVQNAIKEIAVEQGVDLDNIVYVAKNGVDTNPNVTLGTIANPYLTIQAAIDSISGSSSTNRYIVYVMPGDYDENVVLSKSFVYIVGPSQGGSRITSSSGDTLTLSSTTENSTGILNLALVSNSSTTTDNALNITGNNPLIFNVDISAPSGARTVYITGAYSQTFRHVDLRTGEFRIDAGIVEFYDSRVIEALTNVTSGTLRSHNGYFSHNGGDAIEQSGGTVYLPSAVLSSGAGSYDYNQSGGTVYWGWVEYDKTKVSFSGTKYLLFPSQDLIYDNTSSGLTATNTQAAIDELNTDITNVNTTLTTHESDTSNPHSVTFTQAVTADSGTDITTAEAETLTDGSNADTLHTHAATNITYNNTGTELTSTNVQDAINELSTITGVEFTDTVWVAKNGNDSNDGSMDNPLLTVQAGINMAHALGTYAVVFVMPGTYEENLTLYSYVAIYAFGKEPTRIGTNSGTHTLTFSGSGRVFYRGVNFRLDAWNITHTASSGGSVSVWFEDCTIGALTMNGLGWDDYLQFRGSTYVLEKMTVHSAQLSWFDGESQITLGTGDIQLEVDDTGAETFDTTSGQASSVKLRDVEIANKLLFSGKTSVWLYNVGIYNTITVDGTDTILNIDNSSTPADRNDIILLNSATMNLLDDAYAVGYDDTNTNLNADNVQDAIVALNNKITDFDMPSGTVFPTSPAPDPGDIFYRTDLNMTFQYDASRSEWLSVTQMFLDWGANVADGKYLRIHGATATQTGYLMPYNGTIVSITAKIASGNQSKGIEIRRNNDRINPLDSFTLSSGSYSSTTKNIEFSAGDYIQAFVPSAGTPAKDVVVMAVVVWRA